MKRKKRNNTFVALPLFSLFRTGLGYGSTSLPIKPCLYALFQKPNPVKNL
jgi:hypothetical protein